MIKKFSLGPHQRYEGGPVTATVPAIDAGGSAEFNIAVPSALQGDLAAALSGTLWQAGVVSQAAICLTDGTLSVLLIATKPYAGGILDDIYYRSL